MNVAKSPPPNPIDDMSHGGARRCSMTLAIQNFANVLDMSLDVFYISGPAGDFPRLFSHNREVVPTVETALDVLCSSVDIA